MRLIRSRKAPVVQLRPHIASSLAPSPAQEPGEPRGLIMEIIFVYLYLVELNYVYYYIYKTWRIKPNS